MNTKKSLVLSAISAAIGTLAFLKYRKRGTAGSLKNLSGKKILAAYYSRTGNTRIFAEEISRLTGADLFPLVPETPYPESYSAAVWKAGKEIISHASPPLETDIDVSKYDIIFIGTPIWWHTFAPPVYTFLKYHNLSDKVIIPFSTRGGIRPFPLEKKIKKLQPAAVCRRGLSIRNDGATIHADRIRQWLQELTF